ncbi:bifunctional glycosyl transferase/transpeptidase [Candidatus Schneideria nysicola]|nr:bifunctional glycosyl transferase/transpeptidase [Candidatus Schneideria nysicola]UAJ66300.1 bifunctional glycosyl transferase/transpeptidase [Candidatus Schneideria nysicola]
MLSYRSSKKIFLNKLSLILIYFFYIIIPFFIILTIFYGLYLDSQIKKRMNGKIWQLPALVYSRIIHLEPDLPYSQDEIIKLLESIQYRLVNHITSPGEFIVRPDRIELFRRSFELPGRKEKEAHVYIFFKSDKLFSIQNKNNQRKFRLFFLDPKLVTILHSPNGEQRLFMPIDTFPNLLIRILLSVEDRDFYHHDGVNFTSIGRAFLANILARRTIQGGSTLSQQLVKNIFLNNERSLWRKLNEMYMALILDYRYTKDRILELYLNEVYLGQIGNDQIRGFPLASLYYFGRPVNELSLIQQTMLVAMVKGASLYNPWRNPDLTIQRRNFVLKVLKDQFIINIDLYNQLKTCDLHVQKQGSIFSQQPAFIQMVKKELKEKLGEKMNLSGLKIFTTLDLLSQNAAEQAVEKGVSYLRAQKNIQDLEGAMVVVDKFSGEIRAMVGGANPQFAGFNRAMDARRSIGSLAKPATYLTALSYPNQYRLNTWLNDQPISLKQPHGGFWCPKNYDRKFRGKVMLIDALVNSINVPTVNLGLEIGIDKIITTFKKLGVPDTALSTKTPSILLGSICLSPLEVAQEFQTIASHGNYAMVTSIRSVINENGKIIYHSLPQAKRVFSSEASYLILYAMQQVVERGTSRSLSEKFPFHHLAAKTGTTNNLRDSWFAGIDGKDVAIIWIGRDNNGPGKLTGSNGALLLYHYYLKYQPPLKLELSLPKNISCIPIDQDGNFISNQNRAVSIIPVWLTDSEEVLYYKKSQPFLIRRIYPVERSSD